MALAIFDLDNTLIAGDSDYLWGQFMVDNGLVDREHYEAANARFYEDYRNGCLDMDAFLNFALEPLAVHEPDSLYAWRETFIREKILPITLPAARALIARHQDEGDTLLIITATNQFITAPIAAIYGIPHLIATTPEMQEGRYTGRYTGTPCFREGKVSRLDEWLGQQGHELDGSWFYSDSHNDLPLLSRVSRPVAVDPDEILGTHARQQGWPVITLRNGGYPVAV